MSNVRNRQGFKYQLRFKQGAPGGYEGTHYFDTLRARTAFLERFVTRTGEYANDWLIRVDPLVHA